MAAVVPKFYFSETCPFAQRVNITLHELKVDHEKIKIDLAHKPEWYLKINPKGKVPSFDVGHGSALTESSIIAEYVLETYDQHKSLFPADPLVRARIRLFANEFDESVRPLYFKLLSSQEAQQQQEVTAALLKGFAAINELLLAQSAEGPFFLGANYSFVEILTSSFVARLFALKQLRNFTIPDEPIYSRVHQWINAINARESVRATTAAEDLILEGFRKYTLPAAR